ncbi:hypothetical protein F4777DRAFT_575495 [Nemania sp. FL0916]|nr:hypothetical protein F4777DRAFT_575495 [Nemania sp. FL0916]
MAPPRSGRREAWRRSVKETLDGAASKLSGTQESQDHGDQNQSQSHQRLGTDTLTPKMYAHVLGREVVVPISFCSNSYDPDVPPPGTTAPESQTPERYAAWGRDHFGEEWYQQREKMLRERNIYMDCDERYKERQRVLRTLEHHAEGRPSMPGPSSGEMLHETWKRLWARLSKGLPKPASPALSPTPPGNDIDVSGPTPSPRERIPIPGDPWEKLEYDRKRFEWNEEAYQFERTKLLERIIDVRRANREDALGNKLRETVIVETWSIEFIPGTEEESREHELLHKLFHCWKKGMTQEEIEADLENEDRETESLQWFLRRMFRLYPADTPKASEPKYDAEQLEERRRAWDSMEFSKEVQAMLTRRLALPELSAPDADEASKSRAPSPARVSPRSVEDSTRRTRSGRVTKKPSKTQGNSRRPAKRQQSSPTRAGTQQRPSRGRGNPRQGCHGNFQESETNTREATESQRGGNPRKSCEEQRASRRLAGQRPEFGLLLGEKQQSVCETSPQPILTTRRTRSQATKKTTAIQDKKSRDPPAYGKVGRGRPKRSTG